MHTIAQSESYVDFSDALCSLEDSVSNDNDLKPSFKLWISNIDEEEEEELKYESEIRSKTKDYYALLSPSQRTVASPSRATLTSPSQRTLTSPSHRTLTSPSQGTLTPSSQSSSMSLRGLFFANQTMDQDILFTKHGYQKIDIICNTMQGKLYKARLSDPKKQTDHFIAIKECEKQHHDNNIAIKDGMTYVVSENIIKEARILKYLTVDNLFVDNYITKYIDFFESDHSDDAKKYYLIMDYYEIDLKEFVQKSFKCIKAKTMKYPEYHKVIKYICWQLAVTIRWMHQDMNCCHLDLCLENIMLNNCNFIKGGDGLFTINPAISIKLGDFGVAEVFTNGDFRCYKQGLSLDNDGLLAPEITKDKDAYNAKKADIWSLGMVLFECITGEQLYEDRAISPKSKTDSSNYFRLGTGNGYWSLNKYKLKEYLKTNDLIKCFNGESLSLLCNLLDTDESKRYDIDQIIKHKWFDLYYTRNHKQMYKQSELQREALLRQTQNGKMDSFPCYQHQVRINHQSNFVHNDVLGNTDNDPQ